MKKLTGMLVAAVLLFALAAAGCGSSDKGDGGSTGDAKPAAKAADPAVAAATTAVAKLTGAPTAWSGPTSGPAAVKGKNVVYISCGSFNDICVRVGKSIQEAGKTLDWKVTVIDGKATTSGWLSAWNQALALNPDGIIAFTDAEAMKVPIAKAKAKNIPVVGVLSTALPGPDEKLGLFTNVSQDPRTIGKAEAQYAIAKSNGTAKAVVLYAAQYTIARIKADAMKAELAKCTGCKLVDYHNIDPSVLQAQSGPLVTGWVQKHGTPLWVLSVGDVLVSFMPSPLRSAGVDSSKVKMIAADGNATAYDLIRKKQYQVATVPQPAGELGYQASDEMNRAFAGEPATGFAPDLFMVDASNVEQYGGADNTFEPENDYSGRYQKIWSGEGQ